MSRRTHILLWAMALGLGLLATTTARASATDDRVFREANTAYTRGKYAEARQRYEQIVLRGVSDERLYYNLGNTYFRQGQFWRAIWAYEKTLRLSPEHTEANPSWKLFRDTVQSRVLY